MATCKKWVNSISIICANWAEKIDEVCSEWADEGSKKCTQWEECGWNPLSWGNCIAGFFCKAWYWVSKWVCKVFTYIAVVICSAYTWVMNWICIFWNFTFCAIGSVVNTIASIFNRKTEVPAIEHVFVLMLENRSYDHMVGFSEIKGYDSITGEPKVANGVDSALHSNIDPATGQPVFVKTPADYSLNGIDEDPGHSFG